MEKLFISSPVDGLTAIIIISIIAFLVLFFVIAYQIHKNDERKKISKVQARQELDEILLLTKVDKLILLGFSSWSQSDFFLLNYSGKQIRKLGFSRPAILASTNIFKLFIEVSHIKEQIFFIGSISHALAILDKEFSDSHDDDVMKILLNNWSEFNSMIEKIKDYKGIDTLKTLVKKSCPNLLAISNS